MSDRKSIAAQHRTALVDLIVEHVRDNPDQTNAEIAAELGLESDFEGKQRNYLSFSLLADAVASGCIRRTKAGKNVRYAHISNAK